MCKVARVQVVRKREWVLALLQRIPGMFLVITQLNCMPPSKPNWLCIVPAEAA